MDLLWVVGWVTLGWVALTVAVLQDAIEHGHSGWWGVATLVFGVFAALLYLINRDTEKIPVHRCGVCNWVFYSESKLAGHEENTGHSVKLD